MRHTTSTISVFKTNDYDRFVSLDGNRPLNQRKIKNIIKEIKDGNDILDEVPILVMFNKDKDKLFVLDGQHRLAICKQLKRPVHYIMRREMTLHDVAKVNSNQEKWKPADFINCYKTAGNDNYAKIEKFITEYSFPLSVALILLSKGSINSEGTRDSLRESFERGTFEVKHYKEASKIAEVCKSFSSFDGWNTGAFIVAICKIIESGKCDFSVLMKKFSKDPSNLRAQSNWKGYMNNLEEIYNIGTHKRQTIY